MSLLDFYLTSGAHIYPDQSLKKFWNSPLKHRQIWRKQGKKKKKKTWGKNLA